ncbi:hypothetical protein CPB83DRAFT_905738 [Crepidotus variabilis]|uniref:F-box domain-containing protein n=1 Tax=Crepidotus variabilis TaxID=179855 RepID=A0A9P6EJ52_9AGAR|nr:hypothetical protein CPB83DRAFT_905738 [Crepidotus variabilis]
MSQSKTQTCFRLREKHATLMAQARDMAERANALAPISQLPTEIFHAIFFLLAHLHDDVRPPSLWWQGLEIDLPSSPYTREIRRVSQVCRSWRSLALGAPGLWNPTIDCFGLGGGHRWVSETLQRSASVPLNVVVNTILPHRFWLPSFRNGVLNNLSRIERLLIAVNSDEAVSEYVFKKIDKRATILDTLIITDLRLPVTDSPLELYEDEYPGETGEDEVDEDYDDDYESLPFLQVDQHNYPPKLRSLHLSGYMLPLDSSLYTNLTSLRIDYFMSKSLDARAWCGFLSKLENLASLALFDCIWRGRTDHHDMPHLSLPNLRTFKIAGTAQAVGLFFVHLFMGAPTALRVLDVNIRNVKPDDPNFDTLLETLAKVLSQHIRVAERKTLFQFLYSNGVTISDRFCEFEGRDYEMKVRIKGIFNGTVVRKNTLIPTFQSLVTSKSIKEYVHSPDIVPPLPHQVLATLTAPFVDLPGLQITLTSTFNNFKRFFHDETNANLVPNFPLSLPQVKTIKIEEMDWATCSYTGFEHFIRWRKLGGVPLQTLKFQLAHRGQLSGHLQQALGFCEELRGSGTNIVLGRLDSGDSLDSDDMTPYFPEDTDILN